MTIKSEAIVDRLCWWCGTPMTIYYLTSSGVRAKDMEKAGWCCTRRRLIWNDWTANP